jgi:hypothetical protein
MYPVPLIVFLGLMTLLLVLLVAHSPREAVFGAAVVLAGVPVYSAFRRNGSSPVFSRKPIVEEVNSQP